MHTWSIEYTGFWIVLFEFLSLAIFVFTFLIGIGLTPVNENDEKKLNIYALLLSLTSLAAFLVLFTTNGTSLDEGRKESLSKWLDVNYGVTVDDQTLGAIVQNALDYDENTHPYVFKAKIGDSNKLTDVALYGIDEEFSLVKYSAVQYVQQK